MTLHALAWIATLALCAGCGTDLAETTTMPPRPHLPSPSAQLVGVQPSGIKSEGETPVASSAPAEEGLAAGADSKIGAVKPH
ncbi:MAG TPA: hypothetical protein VEC19_10945 [Usitatibacter sp.]|nr:hypothetical protein [Usitatibacter sp.]